MAKRVAVYSLILILAILHQDFWFWNDARLVFGFMPVGLAYHGLYSVMASLAWALALYQCWPYEIEKFAEGEDVEVPWDSKT